MVQLPASAAYRAFDRLFRFKFDKKKIATFALKHTKISYESRNTKICEEGNMLNITVYCK